MNAQEPILALLRAHVWDTLFGGVFFFVGFAACLLAAMRRRGSRLLLWFGLFIGLYGARMLAGVTDILGLAPGSAWPKAIEVGVNYLLLIPSTLFWAELTTGIVRRICRGITWVSAAIAALGLAWYLLTGSPYTFARISLLLAVLLVLALGFSLMVPGVARRYFRIESRLLRVTLPAVAVVALVVDVMYLFGIPPAPFIEPVTFAAFIVAIGLEAAMHTFENERRLMSIQSELETARQIQASTLPEQVPEISGLSIAATYKPMSSVAGDFYQFVPLDDRRIGILVADVTGHGVPAALIASMIKVAMQSVIDCAPFPEKVLRKLNNILTPELKGRLTSAGYLWIDTEHQLGRYAGAGHPPLLRWSAKQQQLERIEENGLLFGVACGQDYAVQCFALHPGDRFLLSTDGLIEPENVAGESFGDRQLESTVAAHASADASALSRELLSALQTWQPASATQQDDITLVMVDVLEELHPLALAHQGLDRATGRLAVDVELA